MFEYEYHDHTEQLIPKGTAELFDRFRFDKLKPLVFMGAHGKYIIVIDEKEFKFGSNLYYQTNKFNGPTSSTPKYNIIGKMKIFERFDRSTIDLENEAFKHLKQSKSDCGPCFGTVNDHGFSYNLMTSPASSMWSLIQHNLDEMKRKDFIQTNKKYLIIEQL